MLWLFADYSSVPEKVGPVRSARPSYVKFSELFDSIFIHWGGSHSKTNYTGGYETISNDGVNDIDGMNGGSLFGRDKTRSVDSEHRGVLYGAQLVEAIANKGYRTTISDTTTTFTFNEKIVDVGDESATSVYVKFSSRTDTRSFSFNSEDGLYHTTDWDTDVSFENIIVLMDSTTYITTPYKTSSVTYLNYSLGGGSGYYFSNGV